MDDRMKLGRISFDSDFKKYITSNTPLDLFKIKVEFPPDLNYIEFSIINSAPTTFLLISLIGQEQ